MDHKRIACKITLPSSAVLNKKRYFNESDVLLCLSFLSEALKLLFNKKIEKLLPDQSRGLAGICFSMQIRFYHHKQWKIKRVFVILKIFAN